jgi:diacylglycerol kinase (ATP)
VGGHHLTPRIALVINPGSGVGRGAHAARGVLSRLGTGASVRTLSGQPGEISARLVAESAAGAMDAVVVVGGDGTVHAAIQALAGGQTPLGVVPAGTGNDVAAMLGMPTDPLAAADALLTALVAGSVRRMDLGRTSAGRWWATVLCAGFDSAVNERANGMRWPRGPRRYDLAIAAELYRLHPRAFRLGLDAAAPLHCPATLIAVGNGPQYGGGKLITPHARLDSGRLHVTVVGPLSRRRLVRLAPTLPHAGHLGQPEVHTYEAGRVRLDAADTLAYADGERISVLPVSTECVPRALPVLVPVGGHGPGFGVVSADPDL